MHSFQHTLRSRMLGHIPYCVKSVSFAGRPHREVGVFKSYRWQWTHLDKANTMVYNDLSDQDMLFEFHLQSPNLWQGKLQFPYKIKEINKIGFVFRSLDEKGNAKKVCLVYWRCNADMMWLVLCKGNGMSRLSIQVQLDNSDGLVAKNLSDLSKSDLNDIRKKNRKKKLCRQNGSAG